MKNVRKRTKSTPGAAGSAVQFSEPAMRNNVSVLEYRCAAGVVSTRSTPPCSRTCQSAVSGCAAGIIGLTGIPGFAFYFACVLVQSVIW